MSEDENHVEFFDCTLPHGHDGPCIPVAEVDR